MWINTIYVYRYTDYNGIIMLKNVKHNLLKNSLILPKFIKLLKKAKKQASTKFSG